MNEPELPVALEKWLRSLHRQTKSLAPADRAELLDGFRSHFAESVAAGASVPSILQEVGSVDAVAEGAYGALGEQRDHETYWGLKRVLQLAASALALGAYVWVLLIPWSSSVRIEADGSYVHSTELVAQSGDLAALIGFALPFLVTLPPLLVSQRMFTLLSMATAALLTVVACLGWISNPGFFLYAPAALAAIAAAVVPRKARAGSPRRLKEQNAFL